MFRLFDARAALRLLPKHLQGDLILAVGLLDHLHQQRLQRVNLRLRECARPSVALLVGALDHVPRDGGFVAPQELRNLERGFAVLIIP